jgi:hypothetical protein
VEIVLEAAFDLQMVIVIQVKIILCKANSHMGGNHVIGSTCLMSGSVAITGVAITGGNNLYSSFLTGCNYPEADCQLLCTVLYYSDWMPEWCVALTSSGRQKPRRHRRTALGVQRGRRWLQTASPAGEQPLKRL